MTRRATPWSYSAATTAAASRSTTPGSGTPPLTPGARSIPAPATHRLPGHRPVPPLRRGDGLRPGRLHVGAVRRRGEQQPPQRHLDLERYQRHLERGRYRRRLSQTPGHRFVIRLVVIKALLIHGVQNAAMHRF